MPTFFKPSSDALSAQMLAHVAQQVPHDTPVLLYHFPAMTGVESNVTNVLQLANNQVYTIFLTKKLLDTVKISFYRCILLFNHFNISIKGFSLLFFLRISRVNFQGAKCRGLQIYPQRPRRPGLSRSSGLQHDDWTRR